jgi:hypothetical protein
MFNFASLGSSLLQLVSRLTPTASTTQNVETGVNATLNVLSEVPLPANVEAGVHIAQAVAPLAEGAIAMIASKPAAAAAG